MQLWKIQFHFYPKQIFQPLSLLSETYVFILWERVSHFKPNFESPHGRCDILQGAARALQNRITVLFPYRAGRAGCAPRIGFPPRSVVVSLLLFPRTAHSRMPVFPPLLT
jgi:hypothetical protein